MILDQNTKLEAVLSGAPSANQPEFHVDSIDYNNANDPTVPTPARGELTGGTDVTLLAAAQAPNIRREVEHLSIYNKDTATVTVFVKTDDGTNERIIGRVSLATLETLHYEKDTGWYVTAANGAIKQGAGISGPASSTDNAVARWDGTTATFLQDSAFIVDDSGHVTSFGGNIKFPASQSASSDANTLDDYEEGTWTPAVTFGGGATGVTYAAQVASYVKDGRWCRVTCYLELSSNGSSTGAFLITGLPFPTANVTNAFQAVGIYAHNLTGVSGGIVAIVAPNATTLSVYYTGTGSVTLLTDTTVTDTAQFSFSFAYRTAG